MSRETVVSSFEKKCADLAQSLSRSATAWIGEGRADKLDVPLQVATLGEQVVYVAILSPEGTVIKDRCWHGFRRPEVVLNGSKVRRIGHDNEPIFLADRQIWVPADNATWQFAGWARVGLSMAQADERFEALLLRSVRILLAVLIAGGLLSYVLTRAFLKPIDRLIDGSKRIAKGEVGYVVRPTNDELGHLAEAFNAMSRDLRDAKDEISNQTKTLEDNVRARTEELHQALAELTELDRLKDEFLSSVSHEFRTPLT